ncbi:Fic family protein [Geodermatophilus sp. SYSU D00710]
MSAEEMLAGTPYLIADGSFNARKFERVLQKALEVRTKAERVGTHIQQQAADVFESFGLVLRSELVSESNRMEHIEWTPTQVREAVQRHRDLLALPVHTFVESVRGDDRTYEALGLYRAQLLAEEWASSDMRPREIEIRQLHGLVVGGAHYAGRYKQAENRIGGAAHVPPAPAEAAEGMRGLASWWSAGTGAPALDAAVVHAWLAHLHPFEDGNGRLARLLANLALSQHGYPPLIIQADSDRGEYYDALAASDDGDVLPLFDLFTRLLRRAVRRMGQPDYIENVIRDRMLTTPTQQQSLWQVQAERFTTAFRTALRRDGMDAHVQGYPSHEAFLDLADLRADGNSWYLKVTDSTGHPGWLLWFGFNSYDYCDVFGGPSGYPSIFLSVRAEDPDAVHPYRPLAVSDDDSIWTQLLFIPGRAKPARLLIGHRWLELSIDDAASKAAALIAART